ncbi:hypothetical protein RZS08_35040, partial [Arthrospira platensis SPKY1]|nr:hypothetical protein [Arthrospira platensis SPKY1]
MQLVFSPADPGEAAGQSGKGAGDAAGKALAAFNAQEIHACLAIAPDVCPDIDLVEIGDGRKGRQYPRPD